jgi:Domain of unknown function (DUF4118)/Dolichyl-phosphate-mannose-protein mannosyltransferase
MRASPSSSPVTTRPPVIRAVRRDMFAVLAALAVPVILTAILVPFRASFPTADAALTLLLMVMAIAASGCRLAGLVAAASAAAWFDFSLTRPYERFGVGQQVDIKIIILLLIAGAAITELAVWGRRRYVAASSRPAHASGQGSRPEDSGAGATETPEIAGSVAVRAPARTDTSHRAARVIGWGVHGNWPLLAVLAVQALLSLRLVRSDTAFQDEALDLWAGRLQWAHWLHGTAIPPFPSYFSGAPVVYPPLGALANSVGGLAAARILSLAFMLGATALLWSAAGRLYGRRAAFFAATLFAVLGPTLHLGAFATYDAMKVFLVALAAWFVIRAAGQQKATGWMIAAGAALALANAAAYSSVAFDLLILVLTLLTAFREYGTVVAVERAATLLAVVIALLTAGLLAGGSSYLSGYAHTNLTQVPGAASPLSVLAHSWYWAGLLCVLAVCGVIISWASGQGRVQTWLLAVLAAAVIAGPLNQARLHTAASLNEHVGLGAWFAAIAAGFAVDRFIAAAPIGRMQVLTCSSCVLALVFPLALGASQSQALAASWPNASSFMAILRPLADHGNGHLLVEDPAVARYYLPSGSQWQRWSSTRNIVLPSGANTGGSTTAASVTSPGDPGTFAMYITEGYFSLVALNFTDTVSLDHSITSDLRRNPHYHIIEVVPYGTEVPPYGQGTYVIWQYKR